MQDSHGIWTAYRALHQQYCSCRAHSNLFATCQQVTLTLLQACIAAAVAGLPFMKEYVCGNGYSYGGVEFKLLLVLVVTHYIQWWTCPGSRVTSLLVHHHAIAHLSYSRCKSCLLLPYVYTLRRYFCLASKQPFPVALPASAQPCQCTPTLLLQLAQQQADMQTLTAAAQQVMVSSSCLSTVTERFATVKFVMRAVPSKQPKEVCALCKSLLRLARALSVTTGHLALHQASLA
jgi:hypothetical protein